MDTVWQEIDRDLFYRNLVGFRAIKQRLPHFTTSLRRGLSEYKSLFRIGFGDLLHDNIFVV